MEARYYWGDVLTELRGAMIRSEDDIKKKLSAQKPGVEAGIWIEQFSSDPSLITSVPGAPPSQSQNGTAPTDAPAGSVLTLTCRAIDLTSVDPSANSEIAYAVETELKNSTNYFDPKLTALTGNITPDTSSGTFTFGVTVTLLNPLKL
jgi:hypothetical protein